MDIENRIREQEDMVLKANMQFFARELMPYFGIPGKVVSFAPTELVHLELRKMFQDFNLVMEDGTWKHFEFQSKNEGLAGLKRFRVYEALTSYKYKVDVTTYVLYSGNIRNPVTEFTEGANTYRIVPIIMQGKNADKLIAGLEHKAENGETITKEELVPLTLCPLMSGNMSIKDRIKSALRITQKVTTVSKEDIETIGMVVYAMADKFLEEIDKEELMEAMGTMELSQMFMKKAKLEAAENLIDLLDERVIAERIGLPLETVQELKKESQK